LRPDKVKGGGQECPPHTGAGRMPCGGGAEVWECWDPSTSLRMTGVARVSGGRAGVGVVAPYWRVGRVSGSFGTAEAVPRYEPGVRCGLSGSVNVDSRFLTAEADSE
jgi:hypothetical protein